MPFLDLDREIERRVGRPVAEIFASEGESTFRAYERDAVTAVAALPAGVIALGGGAVCDQGSLDRMLAAGTVVWLDASIDVLASRVTRSPTKRPLIEQAKRAQGQAGARQKLEQLNQARSPFYGRAHGRFDTGSQAPAEVADQIVAWLAGRGAK